MSGPGRPRAARCRRPGRFHVGGICARLAAAPTDHRKPPVRWRDGGTKGGDGRGRAVSGGAFVVRRNCCFRSARAEPLSPTVLRKARLYRPTLLHKMIAFSSDPRYSMTAERGDRDEAIRNRGMSRVDLPREFRAGSPRPMSRAVAARTRRARRGPLGPRGGGL